MKTSLENSSLDLLSIIGWKDEMPDDAKTAFQEFCNRFDDDLLKKCEIICNRWKYTTTVALEIRDCTFSRVWKYASSFNPEKVKSKNLENGIKCWLFKIANTQLANYHELARCHELEKEDLEIITSIEEMAEYTSKGDKQIKLKLRRQLVQLDQIISGLPEKKRIIYLTYKTYEYLGIYNFKSAKEKLRKKLTLSQASVRKYNNDAKEYVKTYLENINEK